jgi:hypothetical protein
LLLVDGSGCQRPEKQLDEAEQSITSWYATLSLTETQWAERRVPSVYIKQLVDAADKSLDQQAQSIQKVQGAEGTRQARLVERIAFVRDRGKQLREMADGGAGGGEGRS